MFGLGLGRMGLVGDLGFAIRRSLFGDGEQGLWYDLNDDSTIFQDSAGTTLASWGDPVGRVLDKSKGLENLLLYTSNFSAGVDSFTSFQGAAAGNIDGIGGESDWLRLTLNTANGNHFLQRDNLFEIGRTYTITYTYFIPDGQTVVTSIRAFNAAAISIGSYKSVTGTTTTVTDTFTAVAVSLRFYASNGSTLVIQDAGGDDVMYVKDVQVRTIAGNHAIQSTAGSRPIRGRMPKRGRVNLLVSTGNLNGTGWTRNQVTVLPSTIVAPDGTTTADRIYPNSSGTGATRFIFCQGSNASSISVVTVTIAPAGKTAVVVYGADGSTIAGYVNLTTGVASSVAGGYTITTTSKANSFYEIVVTSPAATNALLLFAAVDAVGSLTITANGTDGIAAWRPQLELGSTATAYQHVIDSLGFNVTESGQPSCSYLSFNGSNQWMQTAASVGFSATDEMSVFAGVRKVSDAALASVIEFGTNAASAGGFGYFDPLSASTPNRTAAYRSEAALYTDTPEVVAPVYYVAAITSKRATPIITFRRNGVVRGTSVSAQGAGNYGNAVTYFGSRAGASMFYGGLMFSTIIRGALTSGTLLTRTEQYVARQTPTVNL